MPGTGRSRTVCDARKQGKAYENIDGRLREFTESEPVFVTATIPLAADGE